jgi:hypothetical protein
MPIKLAEAVSVSLVTFLRQELPAALLAVSTDIGDSLVLADVREWIVGERGAKDWPAGWVLVTTSDPWIEENRDSYAGQFPLGLWRHDVDIVIGITDPNDPEVLRTRLYRYVRAIAEVFRQHESYDGNLADWVRAHVVGHHYSRVFQHVETTLFRQDAHVLVQVYRAD